MVSERVSRVAFLGVCALLFAASTAATVVGRAPMGQMAWAPMCGQSWTAAAAGFLGMWTVMTAAMMLPSLVPMLGGYRRAVGGSGRRGRLTVLAGAGYFFVWILVGAAIFPLGAILGAVEIQAPALGRAMPVAAGVVVLAAGALQFSPWKARRLACCRAAPASAPLDLAGAWRLGLRLGRDCVACCAGLTAVLLAAGLMDLRVMAAVTVAITAERLAPAGALVARGVGIIVMAAGVALVARAVGAA